MNKKKLKKTNQKQKSKLCYCGADHSLESLVDNSCTHCLCNIKKIEPCKQN